MTQDMKNKESTYRKSPWRFLFAACAICGAADLLGSLTAWLLYLISADPYFAVREAASIGVIGGADGPTAIFVTGPAWASYIVPAVMLIVGVLGYLRLRKCSQK